MFGLSQSALTKLINLFKSNSEIHDVKIFGSRVLGTFRDGSDIDLAIYGPGISPNTIRSLMIAYHHLNLPYKLDLIHYESIVNTDLRDHIDHFAKAFLR